MPQMMLHLMNEVEFRMLAKTISPCQPLVGEMLELHAPVDALEIGPWQFMDVLMFRHALVGCLEACPHDLRICLVDAFGIKQDGAAAIVLKPQCLHRTGWLTNNSAEICSQMLPEHHTRTCHA